jgi:nitric oxide dioxygenase
VRFIHCARSHKVHAFRQAIDALAQRHPHVERFYCYDEAPAAGDAAEAPHAVGRLDATALAQWLPAAQAGVRDIDAYFLGPKPFMQNVRRSLRSLGVPEPQMRHEFFGPASALD